MGGGRSEIIPLQPSPKPQEAADRTPAQSLATILPTNLAAAVELLTC